MFSYLSSKLGFSGRSLPMGRHSHSHFASRLLRVERLEDRQLLSASRAVDAVNAFGLDVYEHMQSESGNLFYSPLSMATSLAMTYAGAAGNTATEMEQVLHLGTTPGIHESFGDLYTLIQTDPPGQPRPPWWPPEIPFPGEGPDFVTRMANSVWPGAGLPVEQSFIDTVTAHYNSHVENVDFSNPQQAEETINDWVAANTEGRIQNLVEGLSPITVMVLTNSVYMEALWVNPFDPTYTATKGFQTPDGTISTPIMRTDAYAYRTEIDGFDVLDLSLGEGEASMILAMPLTMGGPNVLSTQTLQSIDAWVDSPRQIEQLQLELPRFETTVENKFNNLLIGMGMPSAFDPSSADFTGITPVSPFIQNVFHKATIELTEEGTVAAAATEVSLGICFAAGTPVHTPNGEIPIELIKAGDFVLARDEKNLERDTEPKQVEETKQGVATIFELIVGGRTIRTTAAHNFFARGKGWTPAEQLVPGDLLYCNSPDWVEVKKVIDTGSEEPVFNIRVADYHTYFVGSQEWGFSVWTHNFYGTGYYARQPFHLLLRDNDSAVYTFMGRIDDPSQGTNTVAPAVQNTAQNLGDYNNDYIVNNDDYLVWKGEFGQTGSSLAADGNGNGIVDAADYTVWLDHLGTTYAYASPLSTQLIQDGPKELDFATEQSEDFIVTPASVLRATLVAEEELSVVSQREIADNDLLILAQDAVRADTFRSATAQGVSNASVRVRDDAFASISREKTREDIRTSIVADVVAASAL